MSALNRLLGMASKALGDKHAGGPTASRSGGSTDWRDVVRQAADRITGDERATSAQHPAPQRTAPAARTTGPHGGAENLSPEDRKAIARYDYLVQTAEPQELERIHREAFDRLTPAQRSEVETRMREELPAGEQPRSGGSEDLARAATRSEMMRPGSIRGLLSRAGRGGRAGALGGAGLAGGAMAGAGIGLAGGLLASVAGGAILSSVAAPLLEQAAGLGVNFDEIAGNLDLGAITGLDEMTAGLGDQVSGLGDQVGGIGDQVSGLGEQASNFDLGSIGDFFNR